MLKVALLMGGPVAGAGMPQRWLDRGSSRRRILGRHAAQNGGGAKGRSLLARRRDARTGGGEEGRDMMGLS